MCHLAQAANELLLYSTVVLLGCKLQQNKNGTVLA